MTVLPRETYTGPVLAGSRWRQRGLAGHAQYLVTVLRSLGQSVQLVVEGNQAGGPNAGKRKRDAGKKYNVPLAQFRNSYVLVAQPKGYIATPPPAPAPAPTPTPAAAAIAEAIAAVSARPVREPGIVTAVTQTLLEPPTPAELEENTAVYAQIRREEQEMLAAPQPPPPAQPPEAPPLEAPIAPPAPTPAPPPDDPNAAFASAGRAIVDRLAAQIEGLKREQDEYQAIVDNLDRRIEALEARERRIAAAILEAVEAVEQEAPVPPEPPSGPPVDRSVAAGVAETVMPIGITAPVEPTAPPEGREPGGRRLGQREFLTGLLRGLRDGGQKRVTVAELAVAFAKVFEVPQQRASMNVSSIIVDQMKRATTPDWPVMLRTGKGVYAFLG